MNWAWPPSRCGEATIARATALPRALAVIGAHDVEAEVDPRAKAGRGQDALVLAVEDVWHRPERQGTCRASSAAANQWVVARRPSRSPACPSANAPVQIEATLPPRSCTARSASRASGVERIKKVAIPGHEDRVGGTDRFEAGEASMPKPVVVSIRPGDCRAGRELVKRLAAAVSEREHLG